MWSVGTVVLAAGVAATLADVRSLSRSQGIEALGLSAFANHKRNLPAGRQVRTTPMSPIEDDNKEAFRRRIDGRRANSVRP
jgi:nucleoid DNA-binding protein